MGLEARLKLLELKVNFSNGMLEQPFDIDHT
jgi:hypothetical protein